MKKITAKDIMLGKFPRGINLKVDMKKVKKGTYFQKK